MKVLYIMNAAPFPANQGMKVRVAANLEALRKFSSVKIILLESLDLQYRAHPIYSNAYIFPKRDRLEKKKGLMKFRYALYWLFSVFSPYNIGVADRLNEKRRQKIKQIIDNEKPDVVILGYTYLAELIDTIDRSSTKVIIDTHNVESRLHFRIAMSDLNLVNIVRNLLMGVNTYLTERNYFKMADQIWAVSDEDVSYYCKRMGLDLSTRRIPNVALAPLNTFSPFKFDNVDDKLRLAFVGFYGYSSNEEAALYLINLSNKLSSMGCEHQLVLIGRSPTSKMCRLSEDSPNILITGEVASVESILSQCDILVAPLKSGAGTKLKIIQALQIGMPVLTTHIGIEGITFLEGNGIRVVKREKFMNIILNLNSAEIKKFKEEAVRGKGIIEENLSQDALLRDIKSAIENLGGQSE